MNRSLAAACLSVTGLLFSWVNTPAAAPSAAPINFNRDIRPILSDTCFKCHGPDAKQVKGGLRLDQPESATQPAKSGKVAIVPKQPGKSELVRRITTKDEDDVMPPTKTGKKLTPQQIELLKRWVEQGGEYQTHWAYKPLAKPGASSAKPSTVDSFIAARLASQKLKPQPDADRVTLIRRVSFDLTGLPPKPADVEAFIADKSANAYEKLVDRLLASPHYGERLAMSWLDLVRYADTRGYHGDQHQSVTPYRDYVINSFNQNKRFDVFTAEQLAGDLLPGAGEEQRVASGYNKLLMTTEEGGAQAKEYTAKYAADRVRNASVVWLGSTLGCSECHDHKYDPFTQRDFYSFAAFFADVKETAVGKLDTVPLPTPEQQQQLAELDRQISAVEKEIKVSLVKVKYEEPLLVPDIDKPVGDVAAKPTSEAKDKPAAKVDSTLTSQRAWETKVKADKKSTVPKPVVDAIHIAAEKRPTAQQQTITDYYVEHVWSGSRTTFAPLHKQVAEHQSARAEVNKGVLQTMVAMAVEPRMVRVLPRGNWLSDAGDIVQPAVPAFLGKVNTGEKRATRLDLAQWITSPENPLAARVFVNRVWKLLFGRGIVTTAEDFGAQGANPSHPELLDSLAAGFIASGWDVKRVVKLIAMSDAYRRASRDTPELRLKDPYNALLARQGRFRLDAEMVRDNALAVSGLLVEKVGGTSARPYQPAGYWSYLNFPKREWENDKSDGLYRRGVYTYWCRTFLHPSLSAFDASTREECVAERVRSNTPQQALVLLNDPTYVEAARAFAERIVREGGKDVNARVNFAFQQALARPARPDETKLLAELHQQHAQQYAAEAKDAEALLKVGAHLPPKDLDAVELAAWTSVARVVLNLHETITRN